jgi:hypothetical protein
MNTLIRASAFAALGFAAFRAVRFLLDSDRGRRLADAKAVSAWEGEGGNLAPTGSTAHTEGSLSETGEGVATMKPLE